LDDLAVDEHDKVYQHGLRIADEIRSQMHIHGRKRHFDDGTTTTAPTTATTTTAAVSCKTALGPTTTTTTTTTTTDADKKNGKFTVNEDKLEKRQFENVAPHHRAGIAELQRDRHAGRQLNFVKNKDKASGLHTAARTSASRRGGYGATRSSSLRRRRSVKMFNSVLDIASQVQFNGCDMVGTISHELTSCVSVVRRAVRHFLV
jgi:hypothetical protein